MTLTRSMNCLEQIFTLTLVTLPPGTPTTNTLLQQIASEMNTKRKQLKRWYKSYHNLILRLSVFIEQLEPEDQATHRHDIIHKIAPHLYNTQ